MNNICMPKTVKLMKKIKYLNKPRDINAHWLKDLILLKCHYFSNGSANSVKFQSKSHQEFFYSNWPTVSKIYEEKQRKYTYNSPKNLEK